MFLLCYTNTFKHIWPIFGSANQLMAALTLVVVSVWLALRSRPFWFAILPAVFIIIFVPIMIRAMESGMGQYFNN